MEWNKWIYIDFETKTFLILLINFIFIPSFEYNSIYLKNSKNLYLPQKLTFYSSLLKSCVIWVPRWKKRMVAGTIFCLSALCYMVVSHIRGLFGKYRAYLHISTLALFFIIGRVASFKVIPSWLNNTVPAMFLLLETVLELTFWNGLQLARRITLNHLDVVEPLSFGRHFQFWEHPKHLDCTEAVLIFSVYTHSQKPSASSE